MSTTAAVAPRFTKLGGVWFVAAEPGLDLPTRLTVTKRNGQTSTVRLLSRHWNDEGLYAFDNVGEDGVIKRSSEDSCGTPVEAREPYRAGEIIEDCGEKMLVIEDKSFWREDVETFVTALTMRAATDEEVTEFEHKKAVADSKDKRKRADLALFFGKGQGEFNGYEGSRKRAIGTVVEMAGPDMWNPRRVEITEQGEVVITSTAYSDSFDDRALYGQTIFSGSEYIEAARRLWRFEPHDSNR